MPPFEPPSRRRRTFGRRGWLALGMVVLVLLLSAGSYLAYENTLPTTLTTNLKSGQKGVPTDGAIILSYSRSISIRAVRAAFTITPATDGNITPVSGQQQYAWTPTKPLQELATYTVTLKPTLDTAHHHVNGGQWRFTTLIIPPLLSVPSGHGSAPKDGMEVGPGTAMKLAFNDAMEPVTIKVTVGGQIASLKWAADDKSATFSTAGLPSGPLLVRM